MSSEKSSFLLSNKSLNSMGQKSMSSLSHKIQALAHNISQLTENKWSYLDNNVESLQLNAKLSTFVIRYAYLFEGDLDVCELGSSKPKVVKRYVFLFDGLLILLKKQATAHAPNTKMYKFKQTITLDKYYLSDQKDNDDELSFGLKLYSNPNSAKIDSKNQDPDHILFTCSNVNQKDTWLSMLCYSQYKVMIDTMLFN
jgi:hypothetical protein